jgi:hypothetical protein
LWVGIYLNKYLGEFGGNFGVFGAWESTLQFLGVDQPRPKIYCSYSCTFFRSFNIAPHEKIEIGNWGMVCWRNGRLPVNLKALPDPVLES